MSIPEVPGAPSRRGDELVRVHRELVDPAIVVRVAGEVDLSSAGKVAAELHAAALAEPRRPLIADLGDVRFLGSAGLVALVREHEWCTERGQTFRVVSASRAVRRTVEAAGLGGVLPVLPTLDEALAV